MSTFSPEFEEANLSIAVGFDGAQNAARRRGFATTAFANKAQRFTLIDEKADAINSPNLAYDAFEETFLIGKNF